jgi:integrase
MMKILESEPDEVYRTFFAFLWVTGARPWIEAAPLMWDDILKQDDGYYFRGAKTKKGREPRPIPNWFVPHIEKLGGTGRVFPGNMDQSKVAKHWKNAIEKAGVPHTRIYDLRHSRATLNAQDGVEPQINAALLGQTDSRTTQRYYVHIQQNSMRNAVEKA